MVCPYNYTILFFFIAFNLSNLHLLRWTNEKDVQQELRIIRDISPVWKTAGDLLEIHHSDLKCIEMEQHYDPKSCCREVMLKWLNQDKPSQYSADWQGLYKLLNDLELGSDAKQLKNAFPHLNFQS